MVVHPGHPLVGRTVPVVRRYGQRGARAVGDRVAGREPAVPSRLLVFAARAAAGDADRARTTPGWTAAAGHRPLAARAWPRCVTWRPSCVASRRRPASAERSTTMRGTERAWPPGRDERPGAGSRLRATPSGPPALPSWESFPVADRHQLVSAILRLAHRLAGAGRRPAWGRREAAMTPTPEDAAPVAVRERAGVPAGGRPTPRSTRGTWRARPGSTCASPIPTRSSATPRAPAGSTGWWRAPSGWAGRGSRSASSTRTRARAPRAARPPTGATASPTWCRRWGWARSAWCSPWRCPGWPATRRSGTGCWSWPPWPARSSRTTPPSTIRGCSTTGCCSACAAPSARWSCIASRSGCTARA